MKSDLSTQGRHCPEAAAGLLARYEFGTLSDDERRAFELHLLECDACFAELERGSAVVAEMKGHGSAIGGTCREKPAPKTAGRGWLARWLQRLRG